jgi:phosphatidylserine/phosphatidylglycerophosphate/cardiolipin synthase-like enzyme
MRHRARDEAGMPSLSVHIGEDARTALCDAFDHARYTIDAEFYSIDDADVVASLDRAADRGVKVRITLEGDTHRYRGPRAVEPPDGAIRGALDGSIDVVISRRPHALVHGKAAVVDGSIAFVATANVTRTGFDAPGEIALEDRDPAEAAAVLRKIDEAASGDRVRTGLRDALRALFASHDDLRVASEDLSDWRTVAWLVHRARTGRHDRVLVGPSPSRTAASMIERLVKAGVDVRSPHRGYMHAKLVDDGAQTYVGSANLTRNGIDESYEVGVIASASDFSDGGDALRADFDGMWACAKRIG